VRPTLARVLWQGSVRHAWLILPLIISERISLILVRRKRFCSPS